MESVGVPAGPILNVKEMHEHPQTAAREMVVPLQHPVAGDTRVIGLPVKFADTPGKVQHAAPVFGQHTREVMREYGFSETEIDAMASNGDVVLGDLPEREAAE